MCIVGGALNMIIVCSRSGHFSKRIQTMVNNCMLNIFFFQLIKKNAQILEKNRTYHRNNK